LQKGGNKRGTLGWAANLRGRWGSKKKRSRRPQKIQKEIKIPWRNAMKAICPPARGGGGGGGDQRQATWVHQELNLPKFRNPSSNGFGGQNRIPKKERGGQAQLGVWEKKPRRKVGRKGAWGRILVCVEGFSCTESEPLNKWFARLAPKSEARRPTWGGTVWGGLKQIVNEECTGKIGGKRPTRDIFRV